jgi:hypothetical protein
LSELEATLSYFEPLRHVFLAIDSIDFAMSDAQSELSCFQSKQTFSMFAREFPGYLDRLDSHGALTGGSDSNPNFQDGFLFNQMTQQSQDSQMSAQHPDPAPQHRDWRPLRVVTHD